VLPLKLVAVQISLLIDVGDKCLRGVDMDKEFDLKTTSVLANSVALTFGMADLRPGATDDDCDCGSDLSTGLVAHLDDLSNKYDDDDEEEDEEKEPVDRAGEVEEEGK